MTANASFASKAEVWFWISPDPAASSPPSGRKPTYLSYLDSPGQLLPTILITAYHERIRYR
jgi:hypothetical protein